MSTSPTSQANTKQNNKQFFLGAGELATLIVNRDWQNTPLGPIGSWPQNLKNTLKLILNSSLPMFIVWGKAQTFLYNEAFINLLSLVKHPQALGLSFADVCSENWHICKTEALRVLKSGLPSIVNNLLLFMPRDGHLEETYYSFSYSPVHDDEQQTQGVFCTAIDMTNHLINARRLKMLEKLSAQAFVRKNIKSACISAGHALAENYHDIPFALIYLKQEAKKQLQLFDAVGLAENASPIAPAVIEYSKKNKTACVWPIEDIMTSGQSIIFDTTRISGLPMGQANQIVTEAIILPIILIGEINPSGLLILGMNPCRKLEITSPHFYEWIARKIAIAIQNAKAYELEKQRVEAFEDAISARDQFISVASHELKTPLTSLKLHIQMAKRKVKNEKLTGEPLIQLSNILDVSVEIVNRLTNLIDDLFDIAKIRAGKFDLKLNQVCLKVVNDNVIKRFSNVLREKKIALSSDIPDNLIGLWDEFRIEQVIVNLLSNAIKYAPGSPIKISAQLKNGFVEYVMKDHGPGIAKEKQDVIFRRFERVTNAKAIHGLGLGLFIVQEIIENHQGSISVDSDEGQGCTFIVKLPLFVERKVVT